MAELATVARPYAEALFRVASTSSDLSGWSDLVARMGQVAALPEMKELADNPKVSDEDVAAVFTAALKTNVSAEAQNFIRMLIENGRLSLAPEIAAQFQLLKNAMEGAADARIVSAYELSEAQVNNLVNVLEKKFARKLNPSVAIDASLIGGVRVEVGDQVLDTSVRAKLQKMHAALVA